jgi:hypothetical protein
MRRVSESFAANESVYCMVLLDPHVGQCFRVDVAAILSRRNCICSMMRKEGDITFNGAPPNKNMKRNMGFVLQVSQE